MAKPQTLIPILNPDNYTGEERKLVSRLCDILYTPLRKMENVSDEFMDRSYDIGYTYYEAGDYEKAEMLFRTLTVLDHLNISYWKALGAALQMQGKIDDAIQAYAVAMGGNNQDADLFLHVTECMIATGNYKGARLAAAHLIKITKDDPDKKALFERATALAKALEDKKNENESANPDEAQDK